MIWRGEKLRLWNFEDIKVSLWAKKKKGLMLMNDAAIASDQTIYIPGFVLRVCWKSSMSVGGILLLLACLKLSLSFYQGRRVEDIDETAGKWYFSEFCQELLLVRWMVWLGYRISRQASSSLPFIHWYGNGKLWLLPEKLLIHSTFLDSLPRCSRPVSCTCWSCRCLIIRTQRRENCVHDHI